MFFTIQAIFLNNDAILYWWRSWWAQTIIQGKIGGSLFFGQQIINIYSATDESAFLFSFGGSDLKNNIKGSQLYV